MPEPERTSLDAILRRALHDAAQPGDPTGVAELVRARLMNDPRVPGHGSPGTPGTPGSRSSGPGAVGTAAGVPTARRSAAWAEPPGGRPAGGWIASEPVSGRRSGTGVRVRWIAGATAVMIVLGAGLVFSGVLDRPGLGVVDGNNVAVTADDAPRTAATTDACPGSDAFGSLVADYRDDSAGRARDGCRPVVAETGAAAGVTAEPTVEPTATPTPWPSRSPTPPFLARAPDPAPAPAPQPAPAPAPEPAPAPTTDPVPGPSPTTPGPPPNAAPQLVQVAVADAEIWTSDSAGTCGPTSTQVSADATDDAGVAGVTMSWSGTTVPMSSVAWTWSGTIGGFSNADVPTATYTDVAVTVTAVDTAGASATAQVTIRVRYCAV